MTKVSLYLKIKLGNWKWIFMMLTEKNPLIKKTIASTITNAIKDKHPINFLFKTMQTNSINIFMSLGIFLLSLIYYLPLVYFFYLVFENILPITNPDASVSLKGWEESDLCFMFKNVKSCWLLFFINLFSPLKFVYIPGNFRKT